MGGQTDGRMDGRTDEQTEERTDGRGTDGWMDRWTEQRTDGLTSSLIEMHRSHTDTYISGKLHMDVTKKVKTIVCQSKQSYLRHMNDDQFYDLCKIG